MAKENIKAIYLRFDLADEDERKAYDYLQNRDKAEFGSYTKLVSQAVNEFFERRSRLKDDICATAKGYEFMAKQRLQRSGGKF